MRLFHKQILHFLLLYIVLFGGSVYLAYTGLHDIVALLASRSAVLLADQYRGVIASVVKADTTDGQQRQWTPAKGRRLRQRLLQVSEAFPEVEDFFITDRKRDILFSLNMKVDRQERLPERADSLDSDIRVTRNPKTDRFEAAWRFASSPDLAGFIILDPTLRVGSARHSMTIRFYLLGFGGILLIILLSIFSPKALKSPMKNIEKALNNIDKRKYGTRLKFRKDDEFADFYRKANEALGRMEQLDAAQRKAVVKKNRLLKEVNTTSRFMDILAHEIKNPLHAFGLNLDVLRTKVEKGHAKQDMLKHLNILEQESEHLQEVVQGFLRYVRPGVPQKEKLQINAIIKEVCESAASEAEKAKIKVETRLGRGLREVYLDRSQLQQALQNVVINAIHATGEGGKINIRSWMRRKKILVCVKDTGAGIDKKQQEKIFDLYYTTKKGGSGIGLPVTKRIVEANGGQLELESEVGRGTTVTFAFPAA